MVEQLTFQTIGILLTGISVTIAVIYYTMTLRNANKIRKAQLISPILSQLTSDKWQEDWVDLVWLQDFSSFLEWREKYGPYSKNNKMKSLVTVIIFFDVVGTFVKDKLIDLESILGMLNISGILVWMKCKPVIEMIRKRYQYPGYGANFEYLYNETKKLIPEFTIPTDLTEEELTSVIE